MRKSKKLIGIMLVGVGVVLAFAAVFYFRLDGKEPRALASTPETQPEQRRMPVVVAPLAERDFVEKLVVQGNCNAKRFAMVPSRVGGTIEALYVDEGDTVVEGETKLFQVDSLKLQKALDMARQELAVAQCGLREKEANREQVIADYDKAKIDYERYQKLYKDEAVSLNVLEQMETRFKQAQAMSKHADSLVDLATEQERQARASLVMAEKDLSDSLVLAPLSGSISKKFQELGEMAEVGKPIFRVDDLSTIEASALLPAQYYERVQANVTPMRIKVYGVDAGEYPITYKSPTIDETIRSFEVKCIINNPPQGVAPGAMADIEVVLERRHGLGAPSSAILSRGGGSVLFTIENELAKSIEVKTGLESDGWTELINDVLKPGTPVVTVGQNMLNNGSPVNVQQEKS